MNERNGDSVLCEVREISQDFTMPDGRPRRVLEHISLAIRPNEVVALLGPSGCGKSTLLRILAGLIRPTAGEVLWRGEPLTGLNPGAGIVFQSFALFPWMTVAENIRAVLDARGMEPKAISERVDDVLHKVGLGAFADAYPRELSGGMKQRVGIARALSIDPVLLFMDEPFSQVDALTAETLRAEVIDIWSDRERNPSSILMVSHDIKEVVFMADRVVVLTANPGRVARIFDNPLPRPRDYRSTQFQRLVDQLHDTITGTEMPDVGPGVAVMESLPTVGPSEVIGLLEYLDARGGREDVFRISGETGQEFGHLIAVAKAAEMLDLVDTPRNMVVLEPDGRRLLATGPSERRAIWREQLLKLRLFRLVENMLERQPDHQLDGEVVLETIAVQLPQEDYQTVFETLTRWARYGDLFQYDDDTNVLSLPKPE